MPQTLLGTKLFVPPTQPKLVPRPQLIEWLNQGLHLSHKLTLVSAPAGFGKTTCISEWANTLDCPVTWLSLDPGDDDPGRFLAYFIAALQKIEANSGREIEGILHAGQLPPSEITSATLINDILEMSNLFLLVLDDFHVIQDRFILQVLEQLVANPPPSLHLVLITREDPPLPLARLRANNEMTEIRARELRFSSQDAESFLNEVLELSLSKKDIATLEAKTEGWIAGLQLAGLTIRDRPDPSSLIERLSGSHRLILSYLTEQVLDRQPEEIRQFLLQTAILNELNEDLCNAVTGRSDSRFLLERLFNSNLFLIPLDDEGKWYRYYHLFADLLRDRQNALWGEKTAVYHQRASHWYAQREMASEAIQHALAAEDYALAVDLLESHAMKLIMQGYVKTVNGWVLAIPEQWQSQSPKTNLAFAWMHFLRGAYAQAWPYLKRLGETLADVPAESQLSEAEASLKADWLVMQSLVLHMQGNSRKSKVLAERALDIVPEQDDRVRSLAYYALASADWMQGDYSRATEAYRLAIQHGKAAENLVAEMMSTINLAMMVFERGQLHLAYEIAAPFGEREKQSDPLPPISAVVYGVLGEVCIQWNQIEQARHHIKRSLQLSKLGGYNTSAIFCHVTLSRLAQIEGDLEAAAREMQTAVDLLPVEIPEYVRQEIVAQQVRVYLARNRPIAAELALQGQDFSFKDQFTYPDLPPEQSLSLSLGLLYNSSLRLLLYQARIGHYTNKLKAGIELANHIIAATIQRGLIPIALETLLLRAQMHNELGDHRASQADLINALKLGEPEGFIGVFVEQGSPMAEALTNLAAHNQLGSVQPNYVERILAAFSKSHSNGSTHGEQIAPELPTGAGLGDLVEPLTDRELEVLHLMAEGLKYKEIAAKLFISLNTVRFHVKAIYSKLNVNNRTQAIETARQLRIF